MIIYRSGLIKIIHIRTLKEHSCWNLKDMKEGEEITCGSFSPGCKNFVLGTSHGFLFFGHYVKEGKVGLSKETGTLRSDLKISRITTGEEGLIDAKVSITSV
jgi:hypothetical protein